MSCLAITQFRIMQGAMNVFQCYPVTLRFFILPALGNLSGPRPQLADTFLHLQEGYVHQIHQGHTEKTGQFECTPGRRKRTESLWKAPAHPGGIETLPLQREGESMTVDLQCLQRFDFVEQLIKVAL